MSLFHDFVLNFGTPRDRMIVGYSSIYGSFNGSTSPMTLYLNNLQYGIGKAADTGDTVYVVTCSSVGVPTVSGYTALKTQTYIGLYRKILTAADTSCSITFSTGQEACAVAVVVRGADPYFPEHVLGTTASGSGTEGPNPNSITTTIPNCVILTFGGVTNDGSTGTATPNLPKIHYTSDYIDYAAMCAAGHYFQPGIGAVDPGWNTVNTGTNFWAGWNVAVSPIIKRPTFVGSDSVGYAGRASGSDTWNFSLTGGTHSAPQSGDKAFLWLSTSNDDTAITRVQTAGWSQIDEYANTLDTHDFITELWYKVCDGTETSIAIGPSGNASDGISATLQVFRNCTYELLTRETGTNTGQANPGAQTFNPNEFMLWFGGTGGGGTFNSPDFSAFTSSDLLGFESTKGADNYDGIAGGGYLVGNGASQNPAQWGGASTNSGAAWTVQPIKLTYS